MTTALNYTINAKEKKPERQKLKTKTALSMQAILEGAMDTRQPQGAGGPMPNPKTINGFGRSI